MRTVRLPGNADAAEIRAAVESVGPEAGELFVGVSDDGSLHGVADPDAARRAVEAGCEAAGTSAECELLDIHTRPILHVRWTARR